MNDTPTPRTDEWETYCDESYYHLWRVRRKNERGFNDGYHVHNGDEARALVDLLNKQDSILTYVTEQRDGLRSGIDYASDQLHKVTKQRDRLAKATTKLVHYIKQARAGDSPIIQAQLVEWIDQSITKVEAALQSLTTNEQ
jgi:hypothetical protein